LIHIKLAKFSNSSTEKFVGLKRFTASNNFNHNDVIINIENCMQ